MHPCSLWHRKSAAFTVAIYFQLVEWHIAPLVLPRQGITFNIVECSLLVHKEIKTFFQNLSGNNYQAVLPRRLVEKAMAPHSSTLAWKTPWTEEPCRLQSMGLLGVWHFIFTFHFHALEKEMAIHSSVLAWRIPGTGEPGRLLSMGSHRVGHDWSDLAATTVAIRLEKASFPSNPKERQCQRTFKLLHNWTHLTR